MAKAQKSYTVSQEADEKLAKLAKLTSRTKGGMIEALINEAAKTHGID